MNEEIIKMARKAGGTQPKPRMQPYFWRMHEGDLERFFRMAQAAEREACAKVCVEQSARWHTDQRDVYVANECAAAIRARKS